ncbi:peptidase [Arthrobacter sp. AET 35A]|nr:peptidase [Arthrobacter sp. AET 35A]
MDREWFYKDNDTKPARRPEPGPGAGSGVQRSPSGRVPLWALEESLNGQLQEHAPGRTTHSRKPKRVRKPRRRRSGRGLRLGTVGVIALVVGLYLTPTILDRYILAPALPYLPGSPAPPRGVDASDVPLGLPPASNGSTSFVLEESPDDSQDFVAYDPCRPVDYVLRPDFAPAGTDGLIEEAVAEISAATGLTFAYRGITSEAPSEDRDPYQPDRYGKRWAPILISWTSPAEIPGLEGDVAGLGGSLYAHTPGKPFVYVAGQIQLDAPDANVVMQYPNGRDLVKALIVHELAHVVGLDHVDDPSQLMYEENNGLTALGDGDRAGLALLGAGPCVPQL